MKITGVGYNSESSIISFTLDIARGIIFDVRLKSLRGNKWIKLGSILCISAHYNPIQHALIYGTKCFIPTRDLIGNKFIKNIINNFPIDELYMNSVCRDIILDIRRKSI